MGAKWEDEPDVSRILIVDDHPGFRRFARSLLESEGFDVIGEAQDEASALAAVGPAASPAWSCSTCCCPDATGSPSPSNSTQLDPALAIVLTSSRPADEFGGRLRAAPVAGFVHKDDLSGAALAAVVG